MAAETGSNLRADVFLNMFTTHLNWLLSQAIDGMHLSPRHPADLEQRFERLRGSALFPRGSRKNVTHLTSEQVAAGLLCLATPNPGYAAVVSGALMRLRPVGGKSASFHQCENLGAAIVALLDGTADANSILEI